MRKFYILALTMMLSASVFAQHEVSIGKHKFTPPTNVKQLINSKSGLDKTTLANGRNYVLIQFDKLPTAKERKYLQKKGVILNDYLGGNAYFASLSEGNLSAQLSKSTIRSVIPVKTEWKINSRIANNNIPDYADAGNGWIKTIVSFSSTVERVFVEKELNANGFTNFKINDTFKTIDINLDQKLVKQIASFPWVTSVSLIAAPRFAYNNNGRTIGQVNILSAPANLNGRGLTGQGVKVGIWDTDIENHVDLGSRVHIKEAEMPNTHGMHVAGTVAGAGILNPLAKGIAPKVNIYTHNFSRQSNNYPVPYEMFKEKEDNNISITQNSYGMPLQHFCKQYNQIAYNFFGDDYYLDFLTNLFPTLTHVFAAGNEQGKCNKKYGTSLHRAKNIITVGAVDKENKMSDFSSWGPFDDGRLVPIISTMGVDVLSTSYNNKYEEMSGTSMACPNASGTIALITERYMQLNKGDEPLSALIKAIVANTADDSGNKGPDYQFGYGILNAEKSVQTIEKKWYTTNKFYAGDTKAQTHNISIPNNMNPSQLRVMLVWNDTVAKKEYAYREKALINNIDLKVNNTLPWVLNAKRPYEPATRGIDNINNIEQVTIDNPSGNISVTVTPKTITSVEQQYVLVWWFEEPKLTLTYPNGGELLAQGDEFVIRWNKIDKPVNIEMSYDGGETYLPTAQNIKDNSFVIGIPKTTKPNSNVMIRINDGKNFDECDAPFSIIPVPENIYITTDECGINNWALSWDNISGIHNYEILKANVEEGTFKVIANITNATSYTINKNDISTNKQNVFTVRAKTDDGKVGRRGIGVLVEASLPLNVEAMQLPFIERFNQYPSKYIKVSLGSNMQLNYVPNTYTENVKAGDHLLALLPKAKDPKWNKNKPFSSVTNKATVRICNLNLKDIEPNKHIGLYIKTLCRYNLASKSSQYRVLINGTPVADMKGEVVMKAKSTQLNFVNQLNYDLSAYIGQNITVDVEFVGKTEKNEFYIDEVKIDEIPNDLDLRILDLTSVDSDVNLGNNNPVTITIENNSSVKAENVMVGYAIKGKEPVFETIKEVKPAEQIKYTFMKKVDFTTDKPLGELFEMVGLIKHNDDTVRGNDVGKIVINNLGNVFPIEESGLEIFYGTPIPTDPQIVKTVKGHLTFTDMGGALNNYLKDQYTSVRFVPSSPNKVIQITFRNIDLMKGHDFLQIYSSELAGQFPDPDYEKPTFAFTGKAENLPTITSSATDGGIVVKLYSTPYSTGAEGWIADVQEVAKSNTYTLSLLPFNKFYSDGNIPVTVNVKNHTPIEIKNTKIALQIDDKDWVVETIASIPANGETNYTFNKKAKIKQLRYFNIKTQIISLDADITDNNAEITTVNDKYYKNVKIKDNKALWIKKIKVITKEESYEEASNYIEYHTDKQFSLYKNSPAEITITANRSNLQGKTIGVFIDWNNDGTFTQANEQYKTDITANNTNTYKLGINIPTSANNGKYRMRVLITKTTDFKSTITGELESGNIKDYTLNLKTDYPINKDLEITQIEAISGKKLSTQEPLKVTIKNNAGAKISNFKLAYKVNNNAKVEEDVMLEINAFEEKEYTFNTKLDMSEKGTYNIKAFINETDENATNNTIETQAYNVVPEENKMYALDISGDETLREGLNFGTINRANLDNKATFEAWIKPNTDKINYIFDGKGIIAVIYNQGDGNFNDKSIVIQAGENKVFYSDPNTIEFNKWQHIAISQVTETTSFGATITRVNLYINGKTINLRHNKSKTYIQNTTDSKLIVAPIFNGMIDEVRVWNKQLKSDDIKQNIYKHLRKADGSLPDALLVEYSFDEGYGNTATMSGNKDIAYIQTKRFGSGENSIWQVPNKILIAPNFNKQVTYNKISDNEFSVEFAQSCDITAIKGGFKTTWNNATFEYNGAKVNNSTTFDFSSGSINLTAKVNIFEQTLTQEIKISGKIENSTDCDLISLAVKKDLNAGLNNDVNVNDVNKNIVLDLSGITDITKVKLSFAISNNAKALINNAEITSENTEIDLSKPVILTVKAANGRNTKDYPISVRNSQTINWDLTTSTYTFGDNAISLNATSTSGMPVEYISTNNHVATVNNGKLIFVGKGTADIKAIQKGGNYWASAEELTKSITVNRKVLNINPEKLSVKFSKPIPEFVFICSGLVKDSDISLIENPEYQIYKNGTDLWDISQGYLPVGKHTIKPKGANTYDINNYTVKLNNGELEVTQSTTYNVTFNVLANNNAIANAEITINGFKAKTNTEGKVIVKLTKGSHKYIIEKEGYAPAKGNVNVKNADLEHKVTIEPINILLQYTTDANGMIIGKSVQNITKGGNGKVVVASGLGHYTFDKWSDNRTDNPRIDKNVNESITVTALFKKIQHNVKYTAGFGGTITGNKNQTIDYGKESTEVTATPNSNYEFVCWSDGNTNAKRTDINIVDDAEYTATFRYKQTNYEFPYKQDFNAIMNTPQGWENIDMINGNKWKFKDTDLINYKVGSGVFAYIYGFGINGYEIETYLKSPYFNIENLNSNIRIEFDYNTNVSSYIPTRIFKIKYRFSDTDTWKDVKNIPLQSNGEKHFSYTFAKSKIGSSNKKIQFAWYFKCNKAGFVLIDNIEFKARLSKYHLTYVAGENGKVNNSDKVELTIKNGGQGTKVTATANKGYYFEQWSDGSTVNPRTDNKSTFVTAIFKKGEKPLDKKYTLSYTADEHGSINGLVYQTDILWGTNGATVTAVPNNGFVFDKWSDGITDNPRTDMNVKANIKVKALFKAPEHKVLFVVSEGIYKRIKDAKITINNQTITTNGNGEAQISLPNGDYSFTVNVDGYDAKSGNFTVNNKNVKISVKLEKTSIDELISSSFKVYPNPTKGVFWVILDNPNTKADVKIYSPLGVLIKQQSVNGKKDIDISKLQAGVYLIRINNKTIKLIKE